MTQMDMAIFCLLKWLTALKQTSLSLIRLSLHRYEGANNLDQVLPDQIR